MSLDELYRKMAAMERRLDRLRLPEAETRDERLIFERMSNRLGISTYTDHFRSGSIPTGFGWVADGDFNGAPAVLNYHWQGTYMVTVSDNTPHFLADAITVYSGQDFYARMRAGNTTEIGVRLDDGSNDNYAEMILDPDGLGAYTVDFRCRAGGGAVTDVPGPTYPASEFCIARLGYGSQSARVYGYVLAEDGNSVYIDGATTGVIAWTPARVGIKVQIDGGNLASCDWFYSTFE